jgi:hypothetical protein
MLRVYIKFYGTQIFLIYSFSAGDWIHCLTHAKQVLYWYMTSSKNIIFPWKSHMEYTQRHI